MKNYILRFLFTTLLWTSTALSLLMLSVTFAKADNILLNGNFADTSYWTSSAGWQTCSGGSGSMPCVENNFLRFSYLPATVSQTVSLSKLNIASLNLSLNGYTNGWGDRFLITLSTNSGASASFTCEGPCSNGLVRLALSSSLAGSTTATVTIKSLDYANFWAGNYGVAFSDVLLLYGISTADTQSSLAASAYALRGVYNLQTATINNGLNYDCTVFDTHGVCISVGGRYTSTDSPGTNNGNALVVASYNLTDHVRVGGYLDQNISNSTPTGIKLNNGSPLAGLFGVWNEHKSGEGLEVRVAAGYGDKDLTVTRSVIGTSEAGVGKSQLTSQAVSTTVSYGTALASNWMVSPYAGVRYTRIKAGRYTEGSSADVTAPLTYDALVQQSTTALAGVRFSGRASPKTLLTMSAGVEQDTSNNNVGNSYNASGVTGLTPITFNSNIQKTRAVANAGVYYDITNTQRIGLNAMYRQEAFQSTNTVTALVTYQVGL